MTWLPVVVFGGIVVVMLCLVQIAMVAKGRSTSSGFMTLTTLTVVAILGALLVVMQVPLDASAPAFGLFGTVAGYLAGRQVSPGSKTGEVKPGA